MSRITMTLYVAQVINKNYFIGSQRYNQIWNNCLAKLFFEL